MQVQLSGMILVIARPLQTFGRFESRIAHAGMNRTQCAHLIPNFFRIRLAPLMTHAARNLKKDGNIVAGARRRFDCLAHALHAALAVRNGSIGFAPRGACRQDDIGQRGSLR